MDLQELIDRVGLEPLAAPDLARPVDGGYCCDLLSDVLAHAQSGDLWITHQRHLNVVAVGKIRNVAGIVFPRGLRPSGDVIARAESEGVNLFLAQDTAFDLAGRLYRALHP